MRSLLNAVVFVDKWWT